MKPLYLKTYGKQKRKLSAWISPQNHKRAFDSSISTDGDTSVFEPPKQTKTRMKRTSVSSHTTARPARKKKAMQQLSDNSSGDRNIINGENVIIPAFASSPPAQQSKRRKKTGVGNNKAVRPAKRKVSCLTINSSDEENLCKASARDPLPAQHSKSPSVHSVSRFVTRRQRGATTKHQLPKRKVSILDSTEDFSIGSFSCSNNLQPFRRRRRRLPAKFLSSSPENSVNVAGTPSFTTKALREISLNESSDHSLGPISRKPIFCSTPSAESLKKHTRLKPLPVRVQTSTPLSVPISCTGSLSSFQKDVDYLDPTVSHCLDQPTGHQSGRNQHSGPNEKEDILHHNEEPSGDLSKDMPTSEQSENHSEAQKTEGSGELPLRNLLSTESESNSCFMTTTEALEWLVEALKEKCLTEPCTVHLKRLDSVTVTQLCSETTYSSCLGEEYFVHSSPNIHPVSVANSRTCLDSSHESINLCLSVSDTKNSNSLQSVHSLNSSEQAACLTDGQNVSPAVDCKYSPISPFTKQSASVAFAESIHHRESRTDLNRDTQLPASNWSQTEDIETKKAKRPIKKCRVNLNKLAASALTTKHVEEFTQQDESHSANDERSSTLEPSKTAENDQTCYSNTPTNVASVRNDNDPETTISFLKETCLSSKPTVNVKRLTLSELKDAGDKSRKLKSPPVLSNSASEDSVSGTDHCNDETLTLKGKMKKKASIQLNGKIPSETEKDGDSSCDTLPGRKKLPQPRKDRKRRSTSVDRPGTSRKACVSGLSVNRWKNKGLASTNVIRKQAAQLDQSKAVDCSILDLMSTQQKQQRALGTTMNFSTPLRAPPVNVSSLLADLTPNSYTWSRFKAALAVHRKGIARFTPRTLAAYDSPARANLADISQDLFATPIRTPLPKHLQSQLHRDDSLSACEDLSDAEKVYAECGQQKPLPWEVCILPHRMKKCVKIGEGTFGEVFSTCNASGDTVALKVIPVEGSEKVNGEDQKTFGEILHEIIISKELSSLKEKQHNQTCGFIGLNDLHCVQGCYPPEFLKAWDKFDQQKGSENDRPDFFENDQTFIILEFEFGGIDLENSSGMLASLGVAKSILHQVTAALAVAEQELHFEHRDLHWGNVLVKTTKQRKGSFLLNGMTHSLETKGVLVRIIDYSLSRLEIDDLTVSCDISKDEELFMGQGDYQFDIYRLMRSENGNNWSDYHPHTNILWLHYLCSKLLAMKYRSSGGRGVKELREELTRFYDSILQYSSATEALQNCPMFK